MEKKIWIGFLAVGLVAVCLSDRAKATIVPETPTNYWGNRPVATDVLTDRAGGLVRPGETFDVFGPGYFGAIIVGEEERWRCKKDYYDLLDARYNNGYYEALDEGVCWWDLNGKQFWNEWSCVFIVNPQSDWSLEVLPSGYGLAVRMSERDYYNWIYEKYYRALDLGVWYIPEPATLVLLGLGGLVLLRGRKRKKR